MLVAFLTFMNSFTLHHLLHHFVHHSHRLGHVLLVLSHGGHLLALRRITFAHRHRTAVLHDLSFCVASHHVLVHHAAALHAAHHFHHGAHFLHVLLHKLLTNYRIIFGVDFLQNDRIWDAELAQMDSDGDGCLNGVEVGDSDGDGEADGNVTVQVGNPGVIDDCDSESLVDERTWTQLKALFDGS